MPGLVRRLALVCMLAAATPAWAQEPVVDATALQSATVAPTADPIPLPRHTGFKALVKDLVADIGHLPSKENALWAGAGGGLALAAYPFDDEVNRAMVGSPEARRFFGPGKILGSAGTLWAAAGTVYLIGRLGDQPRTSHIGMDLIQALVVSETVTVLLKAATQRERPDHSSNNSFPSGHASGTFAFATAFERHLQWRYAVPVYILSSYVAISRLPANRHWLSDSVFGATVGIIAGRTVTRHGRDFPVTISPVPGGLMVAYSPRHHSDTSQR